MGRTNPSAHACIWRQHVKWSMEPMHQSLKKSVVLNDVDSRSFDHLADEYDFVASLEQNPAFFLKHLPERHRRVLDVGCGTGILAHELSRHFTSVVGIDISEPMRRFFSKT